MRKRNIAIVAVVALVIGGGIYNFTNSNKDAVDTYLTVVAKAETIESSVSTTGSIVDEYTCLLYTSPSPRDRQKSRMPSSA